MTPQIISSNARQVAEEELRREVSNAGTDRFSDDEPMVFPVQGFRESMTNEDHVKYLAEDMDRPTTETEEIDRHRQSVKAKTCVLQ